MRTPGSVLVLWVVGLALAVAVFPLVLYHGRLYYAEGGTSPDGPGMLFVSLIYTAPIWIGAWLCFVAIYLWRYPGAVALRPVVGGGWLGEVLACVAIVVSVFLVWLAFARVLFWRPSRLPFVLHLLGVAAYVQYLRAAAVGRGLKRQGDRPPRDPPPL